MARKNVEYQVRPVNRYVVTRYESITEDSGLCSGGSQVVGEFDSAPAAAKVMEAMKASDPFFKPPPSEVRGENQYVIVERSFEIAAMCFYAYTEAEAIATRDECMQKYGCEFRIFSRPAA